MIYGLSQQLGKSMEWLYKNIVWKNQTEDIHAHDIFKKALIDFEGTFSGLKLDKHVLEALKKTLEKKYPLQQRKIRAMFNLKCYSSEGIEDIKRALREGESLGNESNQLTITLISSPLFIVNALSFDPKEGVKLVKESLQKIKSAIMEISNESEFEIKDEPKVLGDKDEREFKNMINEINRERECNNEEDDEYIEDMGTLDVEQSF